MHLLIRNTEPEDIPRLLELEQQYFSFPHVKEQFEREIHDPVYSLITACDKEYILGYAGIHEKIASGQRTLVTTLTKKMAENLTDYLTSVGIKCRYMHHDIATIERMEIIRDLRLGVFDVLIGINLLREGLDIPEVGLVAILDADKEGFLRSETSLIQTVGRAARNADSYVIMYADTVTDSMKACVEETKRRREKQIKYNKEHNIVPQTIRKDIRDILEISSVTEKAVSKSNGVKMTERERKEAIEQLEVKMKKAASMLEYEIAAQLRDEIIRLRGR